MSSKDNREVKGWTDIPGYIGLYQASEQGEIRGLDRVVMRSNGVKQPIPGCILKPNKNKAGRMHVMLWTDGKARPMDVHRLIMLVFRPDRPANTDIHHKNEDATDNRLDNLIYVDSTAHALHHRTGSFSAVAKLTEDKVTQAVKLRGAGWTVTRIAEKFGVHRTTVSKALNNVSWKHVFTRESFRLKGVA